jgi:CPA2 family monovalent cation:H+ antiporter-2
MHIPLLTDIVILLGVSLGVLYAAHGLRLPPVVAFLITGVLLGPHGLAAIRSVDEVEQLAEIGVILVLFAIGLEFSLADLMRMRRTVLLGGTLQVLGVLAIAAMTLTGTGMPPREALFLGMIATLSSTAVVLRLLQQRAEIDAPHGRVTLGILVYQDLAIVPMMLLIPVLAGGGSGLGVALGAFAGKAAGILVLVFVLARFVVPRVLARVVGTQSRDMFLLAVVTVCLLVAWAGAEAGLSLALGAFLAGLVVSESEYSHQALSDILPFRDLFASFFFISIGMLLDVGLALGSPALLTLLVLGVLLVKGLVAGAATLMLGRSVATAVMVGLALSQVGEFSFILAGSGLAEGLMSEVTYQWFLAAAVVSIGLTPFLMMVAPKLASAVERAPLPGILRLGRLPEVPFETPDELTDHVILVGFGVNGHNVARAAGVAGIPLVAIEMNPTVVLEERQRGVNIHYGDASRSAVLEHAGIQRARVVVVAISDAAATRRIAGLAHAMNPAAFVIVRTRYLDEVEPLREAGAHLVIPEELETSVEIVARVLGTYLVPQREIDGFLAEIRAGGYEMLRAPQERGATLRDLHLTLSDLEVSTLEVLRGCPVAGRRLADTDLRKLYGITVVAIRRGDELIPNPGGGDRVEVGDILVVLGLNEEITAASLLFEPEAKESA